MLGDRRSAEAAEVSWRAIRDQALLSLARCRASPESTPSHPRARRGAAPGRSSRARHDSWMSARCPRLNSAALAAEPATRRATVPETVARWSARPGPSRSGRLEDARTRLSKALAINSEARCLPPAHRSPIRRSAHPSRTIGISGGPVTRPGGRSCEGAIGRDAGASAHPADAPDENTPLSPAGQELGRRASDADQVQRIRGAQRDRS